MAANDLIAMSTGPAAVFVAVAVAIVVVVVFVARCNGNAKFTAQNPSCRRNGWARGCEFPPTAQQVPPDPLISVFRGYMQTPNDDDGDAAKVRPSLDRAAGNECQVVCVCCVRIDGDADDRRAAN